MGQSAGHSPKLLYNSCRLFIISVYIRYMCRVTLQHCHLHRITAASLDARLGLHGIQPTIDRLRMGWVGHVARMSDGRLPHRFLTAWIRAKRPIVLFCFVLFVLQLSVMPQWAPLPLRGLSRTYTMGLRVTAEETRWHLRLLDLESRLVALLFRAVIAR